MNIQIKFWLLTVNLSVSRSRVKKLPRPHLYQKINAIHLERIFQVKDELHLSQLYVKINQLFDTQQSNVP